MHKPKLTRPSVMLWPLLALLTACASAPQPLPAPVVQPAQVPPLPLLAVQPPPPAWCLPTCSAGLTKQRASWLQRMTEQEPPASPASGHMTQ